MDPSFDRSPHRERLKRLRIARSLTQGQLADLAGISVRSVRRIEGSRTGEVSLHVLVRLALVLDCESVLDVIEDAWLSGGGVVSPTGRTALSRSAGDDPPPPSRERAPRRSPPSVK